MLPDVNERIEQFSQVNINKKKKHFKFNGLFGFWWGEGNLVFFSHNFKFILLWANNCNYFYVTEYIHLYICFIYTHIQSEMNL